MLFTGLGTQGTRERQGRRDPAMLCDLDRRSAQCKRAQQERKRQFQGRRKDADRSRRRDAQLLRRACEVTTLLLSAGEAGARTCRARQISSSGSPPEHLVHVVAATRTIKVTQYEKVRILGDGRVRNHRWPYGLIGPDRPLQIAVRFNEPDVHSGHDRQCRKI